MFITKEMHRQVAILLEYAEAELNKKHVTEAKEYLTSAEVLITTLEREVRPRLVKP